MPAIASHQASARGEPLTLDVLPPPPPSKLRIRLQCHTQQPVGLVRRAVASQLSADARLLRLIHAGGPPHPRLGWREMFVSSLAGRFPCRQPRGSSVSPTRNVMQVTLPFRKDPCGSRPVGGIRVDVCAVAMPLIRACLECWDSQWESRGCTICAQVCTHGRVVFACTFTPRCHEQHTLCAALSCHVVVAIACPRHHHASCCHRASQPGSPISCSNAI